MLLNDIHITHIILSSLLISWQCLRPDGLICIWELIYLLERLTNLHYQLVILLINYTDYTVMHMIVTNCPHNSYIRPVKLQYNPKRHEHVFVSWFSSGDDRYCWGRCNNLHNRHHNRNGLPATVSYIRRLLDLDILWYSLDGLDRTLLLLQIV